MNREFLWIVAGVAVVALSARCVWLARLYRIDRRAPPSLGAALAEAVALRDAWLRRWLGRWPWHPRFIAATLLSMLALSAAVVLPGAYTYAENPEWTIVFAWRYFAGPIGVAGWFTAAIVALFIRLAAAGARLPLQIALPVLSLLLAAALWVAAVHVGLWLHWRQQFSPFGFATEWYYAEVYITYVREMPGRVILAGTLLPPLAVVLFHLEMLVGHLIAAGVARLWRSRGR